MKCRRGVTLVEMMIALTLFTLVAGSLYALLHVGLRLRGMPDENREASRRLRMMTEFLVLDAANAVDLAPRETFEGDASKLSFWTLVDTWDAKTGAHRRQLARVVYRFDRPSASLVRQIAGAEQDFREERARETFSAAVKRVEFAFPVPEGAGLRWMDRWKGSARPPAGIRVRIDDFETVAAVPMGTT